MIKRKTHILAASLALALFSGAAQAGAQNGFSINGGLISTTTNQTISTGFFAGQTFTYNGGGLSLGLDYQVAINDQFSINPFLMTSIESVSVNNVTYNNLSANHGILGVQFRYWPAGGGAYVGGQIGSYSEQINYTFNNTTYHSNASGGGLGLVAGWENPNGGFYVQGQVDSAKLGYSNTDTKLTSARLSIGYRWK